MATVVIPSSLPQSIISSGFPSLGPVSEASAKSVEELVATLSLHELAYPEAKRRVLAAFTEAYVAALLRMTGGNMSEAARRSGLDRSNFRRLVRPKPSTDPTDDDGSR